MTQPQQQNENGRVGLVDVPLLQFLEAVLYNLLDRVVKRELRGIENTFHDLDDTLREVNYRLPVDLGGFRAPQHDHAKDDLSHHA